jgi:acyl CoA:acetate/3-ketoacid CoA transferase beta subunit
MQHTSNGEHKILKRCTLPFTAVKEVNMIVTELGVMEVTSKGLVLKEIAPGVTVEEVQSQTEATLIISEDLKIMDV